MDVVAANFSDEQTAREAALDLVARLKMDESMVAIKELGPRAGAHAGQPVLVVWLRDEDRELAREVIAQRDGRHVPLDWVQGLDEDALPETFPSL